MRVNSNLLNIFAIIAILILGFVFDYSIEAFKSYAGTTFDFQPITWTRLLVSVVFPFSIILLLWVALIHFQPHPWVYAVYLIIGLTGLLYWPMTLQGFSFLRIIVPRWLSLYLGPDSPLSWAAAFLFCIGVIGLIRTRARA